MGLRSDQSGGRVDDKAGRSGLHDEAQRNEAAVVEDQQITGRIRFDGHHRPVGGTSGIDHLAADQLVNP